MKNFWYEFKNFALKGNVVDMAVGVIIGTAFSAIVNSIVKDLITPVFGIILGGVKFDALSVNVGDAVITYGNFIQSVVNFFIIALTIFIFIKIAGKLFRKKEAEKADEAPKKSDEALLLEQILTSLQKIEDVNRTQPDKE